MNLNQTTDHLTPAAAYRRDAAAFRALYAAMRRVILEAEGQGRLI